MGRGEVKWLGRGSAGRLEQSWEVQPSTGSPWAQAQPVLVPLLHALCGTHREHSTHPTGWANRAQRSPVSFSFCYFISLQWEQLRMSRINENNCWASVQVVNKEPQTLLSPTTKRCWHKKNSIFLCRNHSLNSLVLNRIPCLLPLLFPQNLKTNHTKISYSPLICYIRCFLRNPVVLSPCDVSVRSCLRWHSLETQNGFQNHTLELGHVPGTGTCFHPHLYRIFLLSVALWCIWKHLSILDREECSPAEGTWASSVWTFSW